MNRDDDQQLWDLLGQAAQPRLSPFFARNILRHIRQEPTTSWLRLKILVPAFGVALAVIAAAAFYLWNPSVPENSNDREPEKVATIEASKKAPEPSVQIEKTVPQPEPSVKIESQLDEPDAVAKIDSQDYEVVANLDDLLVLYETSLWDENSSL
jgi:hypothetical protein